MVIQQHISSAYAKFSFFFVIGHFIYFEKLLLFEDTKYRKIDATIEVPNTPRKLKAFIKVIPSILAWKEAVISFALNSN